MPHRDGDLVSGEGQSCVILCPLPFLANAVIDERSARAIIENPWGCLYSPRDVFDTFGQRPCPLHGKSHYSTSTASNRIETRKQMVKRQRAGRRSFRKSNQWTRYFRQVRFEDLGYTVETHGQRL
jgi:hypothetical protein